jgi:hypothetical protein
MAGSMNKFKLLILLVVTYTAQAHSGRTDANGGHMDRKAGLYHCHKSHCSESPTLTPHKTDSSSSIRYNRKDWSHWIDEDGDCQNTRAEVLIEASQEPVKFKNHRGCLVSHGLWVGPYTGITFTKASDLDIDHLVPLAHAHRTGGANWTREMKRKFANDPDNLIAVDDRINQEKGAKDPISWKPPMQSYWCEYARRWGLIKDKYRLKISEAEKSSLRVMRGFCY